MKVSLAELARLEKKIAKIILPFIRTEPNARERGRLQVRVMVTLIHRNAVDYSRVGILDELLNSYELIESREEHGDILFIMMGFIVNKKKLEKAIRKEIYDLYPHLETDE